MIPGVVGTIFRKELLETLRDRRTLVLMILLPMVLYPGLLLVLTQVAGVQQGRMEAEAGRFAITGGAEGRGGAPEGLARRLGSDVGLRRLDLKRRDPEEAVASREVHAVLDLDPGFAASLAGGRSAKATVLYDTTVEVSRITRDRLERALIAYRKDVLDQRLRDRGLDPGYANPIRIESRDLAPPARRGGQMLGQILPMLLILTVILGAFYPAVDLTAGEKERGTIQTLLTAPITPAQIVAGKFLAVCAISFISGAVNIGAMALVFGHALSLFGASGGGEGAAFMELSLSAGTVLALFGAVVLMGMFFSALMMAVAVLARSFKEAQNLLTPVYMACLLPVILVQLPGMELDHGLALIPAFNVALLVKEVVQGSATADQVFLVLGSTAVYAAMVLVLAANLFRREEVLLGMDSGLSLLGRRHRGRQPRPSGPTAGDSVMLFGLLFLLLYYLGSLAQVRWGLLGVAFTLWGLILPGTLIYARIRRLPLRPTLGLRRAPARAWVAAVLLGLGSWAVLLATVVRWQSDLLPTPPELGKGLEKMLQVPDGAGGAALLAAVVALSPAICEELAFRGFILTGLRSSMRGWKAVWVAALLFGLLHLSLHRLLGTFALGALAGFLALRAGSVLPAMLFHALNNGAILWASSSGSDLGWIDAGSGQPLRWVLAVCAALMFVGLLLLVLWTDAPRGEPE